jgi:iron complex outermembrane receptor protein
MRYLFFGLALSLGMALHAQDQGTVSGRIMDAEMYGEPLLMANVAITETSERTMTNFHGNFEFTNLEPGDYTLQVSFLGYKDLKLPITVKAGQHLEINGTLNAKELQMAVEPTLTSNIDTETEASAFHPLWP